LMMMSMGILGKMAFDVYSLIPPVDISVTTAGIVPMAVIISAGVLTG